MGDNHEKYMRFIDATIEKYGISIDAVLPILLLEFKELSRLSALSLLWNWQQNWNKPF